MDLLKVSAALADPVRLAILDRLAAGRDRACCSPPNPDVPQGICACDVLPMMESMGQSRLAYHMKLLREAGLVEEQKRGRWVYYTLNQETLQAYLTGLNRRLGEDRHH